MWYSVCRFGKQSCQRNAADAGKASQNYFHQYFLSEDHDSLIHDCEIIFINKTDPLDPTRIELFCSRLLKIKAPLGLYVDEGCDY